MSRFDAKAGFRLLVTMYGKGSLLSALDGYVPDVEPTVARIDVRH